jgi:hypothetical protein
MCREKVAGSSSLRGSHRQIQIKKVESYSPLIGNPAFFQAAVPPVKAKMLVIPFFCN